MNVRQLIEELQQWNQNMPVLLAADGEGNSFKRVDDLSIVWFEDPNIYGPEEVDEGEGVRTLVIWP